MEPPKAEHLSTPHVAQIRLFQAAADRTVGGGTGQSSGIKLRRCGAGRELAPGNHGNPVSSRNKMPYAQD